MNRDNRKFRNFIIAVLFIAVSGTSIAFAALSQTLSINSTGKVKGSNWDIKWTSATGTKYQGGEDVSFGFSSELPAVNLSIFDIVLKRPGDRIFWIIKVENLGDIDARLDDVSNILNKQIVIDLEETSPITSSDILITLTKNNYPEFSEIAANDLLLAGESQEYILTISFANVNYVPSHDVEITVSSSFPWVQK